MRLPPKSSHVITQPCQINAILSHPRVKINASRLQYVILLLRLITSDKSSRRYPRVSSLNKPSNASLYKDNATHDAVT
jgi:hypothetical protein